MQPTKEDLIRAFRKERGLARMGENGSPGLSLVLYEAMPLLPKIGPDGFGVAASTLYHAEFTLRSLHIGEEQWAYVSCNGCVIVPPFEWLGYEFLSAHVW